MGHLGDKDDARPPISRPVHKEKGVSHANPFGPPHPGHLLVPTRDRLPAVRQLPQVTRRLVIV
jgi:hypothetical protein